MGVNLLINMKNCAFFKIADEKISLTIKVIICTLNLADCSPAGHKCKQKTANPHKQKKEKERIYEMDMA